MSDETIHDHGDAEDLAELFGRQEEPGTDEFIHQLRRRIHRRSAGTHVATFAWELPKAVLVEFLQLIPELFIAVGSDKENKP